jgi:hypothetical protein
VRLVDSHFSGEWDRIVAASVILAGHAGSPTFEEGGPNPHCLPNRQSLTSSPFGSRRA